VRIYRIRKLPSRLVLTLLVIIIVSLVPRLRSGVKNFAFDILAKPLKAVAGAREYLAKVKNLSDENLLLKQRLAETSVTLARMKEAALENKRLALLLDFKKELQYETIVAKVIGRDATDWRKSIIINRGSNHGLRAHMPCATAKGLVGRVADVAPESSKVMLITDPNSRVGVTLEPSRESGVLVGMPGGLCKAIYLSLDAEIKKGERVSTAGFSAFFPKGLVVGKVTKTSVEKTNLYKYAIVNPIVEMNRIEEVICIDAGK
jgi:rod shape-determining protein MreC